MFVWFSEIEAHESPLNDVRPTRLEWHPWQESCIAVPSTAHGFNTVNLPKTVKMAVKMWPEHGKERKRERALLGGPGKLDGLRLCLFLSFPSFGHILVDFSLFSEFLHFFQISRQAFKPWETRSQLY